MAEWRDEEQEDLQARWPRTYGIIEFAEEQRGNALLRWLAKENGMIELADGVFYESRTLPLRPDPGE